MLLSCCNTIRLHFSKNTTIRHHGGVEVRGEDTIGGQS